MDIYKDFYATNANFKHEVHNMQMEMAEKKRRYKWRWKQTDNYIKKERIEVEKVVNVQKTEVIQGFIGSHGKPLRQIIW